MTPPTLLDSDARIREPWSEIPAAPELLSESSGASSQSPHDTSWRSVVAKLLAWSVNPPDVDEGVSPVSRDAIRTALRLVERMLQQEPPTDFWPSVDGGVMFEWRQAGGVTIFESLPADRVDETVIVGGHTVVHQSRTLMP